MNVPSHHGWLNCSTTEAGTAQTYHFGGVMVSLFTSSVVRWWAQSPVRYLLIIKFLLVIFCRSLLVILPLLIWPFIVYCLSVFDLWPLTIPFSIVNPFWHWSCLSFCPFSFEHVLYCCLFFFDWWIPTTPLVSSYIDSIAVISIIIRRWLLLLYF